VVETYGLTHIQLAVSDIERSVYFYQEVLGARELFRHGDGWMFMSVPGARDVLTLRRWDGTGDRPGNMGAIAHFGFRLKNAADLDVAIADAERAGGKLLGRGQHGAGEPFAHVADPDGYDIEIWYSPP
jgi:catechol 2,3-dioxygenase-like lactoylglutathione lyase family enzyme